MWLWSKTSIRTEKLKPLRIIDTVSGMGFISFITRTENYKAKPTGVLQARWDFKNGKREGTSREYYEDGTLKTEWSYADGKLNGISKAYYLNGILRTEENYVDGIKSGVTRIYYENGVIWLECTYENGEQEGCSEYDKEGRLKSGKGAESPSY